MTAQGLARGIMAVDADLGLNLPGERRELDPLLFRDPGSRGIAHPAGHLFKGASERVSAGGTIGDIIQMMDDHGVEMALTNVDSGHPDDALKILDEYPGRFFGTVGVNPLEGMEAVRKLEAIAKGNHRIKAISIIPLFVQKPANDKIYYPIYVKAIELDLPVCMTVGIPGPRVPGWIQDPIHLDEPLWFFPELKLVMMHGGEPWEAMCVKLMLKWPNLYFMTSGFAPKHYPKDIIYYANTRGTDKVLYAGYYPGIAYERTRADLQELQLRDHVWPKFLRENAIRLFKLEQD